MDYGFRFADGAETRAYGDVARRLLAEPRMTATDLGSRHRGRVYTHESTVAAMGYDRAHAEGFGALYDRLWRIAE